MLKVIKNDSLIIFMIFIGIFITILINSKKYNVSSEEPLHINIDNHINNADDNLKIYKNIHTFIRDANKYGLDKNLVDDHIGKLDYIMFGNLSNHNLLGVTLYTDSIGMTGMIIINQDIMGDSELLSLTIYHELGHWFGLLHSEKGIMMDAYNEKEAQQVYEDWNKEVKKLMKAIKKSYKENDNFFSLNKS